MAASRKSSPVLTPEEIARFLEAVAGLRNRVALTTAYAAGLRIGEVCRLKAASIDSKRMLMHVEGGKGAKDRYAMLSPRLLDILRAYWQRAHPLNAQRREFWRRRRLAYPRRVPIHPLQRLAAAGSSKAPIGFPTA
jgi:integrase